MLIFKAIETIAVEYFNRDHISRKCLKLLFDSVEHENFEQVEQFFAAELVLVSTREIK